MTCCVSLTLATSLALDSLCTTWLRALLGGVAGLLAVTACERIDPLPGTVASAVAGLLTDGALDLCTALRLNVILLAVFADVTQLCKSVSTHSLSDVAL